MKINMKVDLDDEKAAIAMNKNHDLKQEVEKNSLEVSELKDKLKFQYKLIIEKGELITELKSALKDLYKSSMNTKEDEFKKKTSALMYLML